MLEEHAEEYNAGVIALVERDGLTWRGAAGLAEGKRRPEPEDCFDIGSIGKTMEATVALQLVEDGLLSLSDSVKRWLPDEIEGGRRVFVRHLLNHTSGLSFTPSFGGITVGSTPGSTYAYSNLSYDVLGDVLAEVTDGHVQREIRDRILVPLGLAHKPETSVGRGSRAWLGSTAEMPGRCGVVSTTSRLARFFRALLGGELLGKDMMAEMTTTVPTGTEFHSGLGIFRADLPCGSAWGNGGDTGLFTSQVLASRDGSTIVIVARNVGNWSSLKALAEQMYCKAI
jgi:D-alanyl-D-alanine carboxypeptidase